MLRVTKPALAAAQVTYLQGQQKLVDDSGAYADQVAKAKELWAAKSAAHFKIIRERLESCCAGASRCHYCEDSVADEVEHFRPKDFFPEVAFAWDNYLFACGPCNGRKNNAFPLLTAAGVHELVRKKGDPVVAPPAGRPGIVDVLNDAPENYLRLDITDTFLFSPRGAPDSNEWTIGSLTIRTLHLNLRENLAKARKEAYGDYFARLTQYVRDKNEGAVSAVLSRQHQEILKKAHPFVWLEMRRSRNRIPALQALFDGAQELL